MKIVAIGDSITKGTYTPYGGSIPDCVAEPNFTTRIGEMLGAETVNYGTNGVSFCSLSRVLPEEALSKRADGFCTGDIVFIAGGTNDFGTDVPLGEKEDDTDTSFYGAADLVFRTLKEKNPSGKFIVITPIPRVQKTNGLGLSLQDYRDALKYKAEKYGFFVVCGESFPLDAFDKNYFYDGTHPNAEGHRIYAEWLFSAMKNGGII